MRDLTDPRSLPAEQEPPAGLRTRVLAGAAEGARPGRVLPFLAGAATVAVLGGGAVAAAQLHAGSGTPTSAASSRSTAQASPAVTTDQTPRPAEQCLLIRSLTKKLEPSPRLLLVSGNRKVAARRSLRQLERSCRTVDLREPACDGTLTLLGLGRPEPAVPIGESVRRLHFRCLQAK